MISFSIFSYRNKFQLFGLMITQFNVHILLVVFFLLPSNVITEANNYKNTTEPIGCNSTLFENINHTRLYYEVSFYSPVELPARENLQPNLTIFWFAYRDLCEYKDPATTFFGEFRPDNTSLCSGRPDLSISSDSCINNYTFSRESMTIKNMTDTTVSEYITFYGQSARYINLTSAIGYFITISGEFIRLNRERFEY